MKALGVKGVTQINDANDPIQELSLKGAIEVIEFDKEHLVEKCYDFIGTTIVEAIDFSSLGLTMWIDEEGKLKNDNHPNLDATIMFIGEFLVQDVIMGHVVFTSNRTDDEGWALGLEDDEMERLQKLILNLQDKRDEKVFATDVLTTEPTEG